MKQRFGFLAAILFPFACAIGTAAERPNVLFIAIDDLNDWVGAFGGHPEAITPNLDKLATEGGMVFQNAHCPGPVCGPSRSAILTGFMPHRSGIYGNANNLLDSELAQTHATLPEYFSRNNYLTMSRGKIAHKHSTPAGFDEGHWMYDVWEKALGGTGVDRKTVTSKDRNVINGQPAPTSKYTKNAGSEFAWGVTKEGTEKTKDYITAKWAVEVLQKEQDSAFFLAVGISKPHLPFYTPQEFWDLYPADKDYTPKINDSDFDDILLPNGKPGPKASQDYLWLKENDLLNEAARAYLACASFADHCVGEVLNSLKNGPHAENTIVVIWGDHGWHLGEKMRYRKAELWTESTRCPLIVKLPGAQGKQQCLKPVNLIDLYPTLIELCGLPDKPNLDGKSFAPLLKDPEMDWQPTLTVRGPGSVSIHDERWNLIHRKNGVRELYDLKSDPMEWTNLFDNPEYEAEKKRLEKFLPKNYAPEVKNSKSNKKATKLDMTIRPMRVGLELK